MDLNNHNRDIERRTFLALTIAGLAALPLASCSVDGTLRRTPNIVMVLADDIGPGDVGSIWRAHTGQPPVVPTPHIDQLIGDGMHFSRAYAPAPLCAPTRFAMLTGNYPYRNGTNPWGSWNPWVDSGIAPENTTIANIARTGGYATAFFGKWGCGGQLFDLMTGEPFSRTELEQLDFTDPADFEHFTSIFNAANHHGFDYALELCRGIQSGPFAFFENGRWMPISEDSHFGRVGPEQHLVRKNLEPFDEIGDSNWDPRLVGPILTAKATDYIRARVSEHPSEPFFLYFCSQAIHDPHTPPQHLGETPIAGTTPTAHGDMIAEIDAQVGALVNCLKESGIYEETLFVFTSDNGGFGTGNSLAPFGHDPTLGLRGSKNSVYEGGSRVPFVVTWPRVIEAGSHCPQPVVAHDIVATVDAITTPQIRDRKVKDSLSLLPIFSDDDATESREAILYQAKKQGQQHANWAIGRGRWKLVLRSESRSLAELEPIALFDLETNPEESETENKLQIKGYEPIIRELTALFVDLRKSGRPTVIASSGR